MDVPSRREAAVLSLHCVCCTCERVINRVLMRCLALRVRGCVYDREDFPRCPAEPVLQPAPGHLVPLGVARGWLCLRRIAERSAFIAGRRKVTAC